METVLSVKKAICSVRYPRPGTGDFFAECPAALRAALGWPGAEKSLVSRHALGAGLSIPRRNPRFKASHWCINPEYIGFRDAYFNCGVLWGARIDLLRISWVIVPGNSIRKLAVQREQNPREVTTETSASPRQTKKGGGLYPRPAIGMYNRA